MQSLKPQHLKSIMTKQIKQNQRKLQTAITNNNHNQNILIQAFTSNKQTTKNIEDLTQHKPSNK